MDEEAHEGDDQEHHRGERVDLVGPVDGEGRRARARSARRRRGSRSRASRPACGRAPSLRLQRPRRPTTGRTAARTRRPRSPIRGDGGAWCPPWPCPCPWPRRARAASQHADAEREIEEEAEQREQRDQEDELVHRDPSVWKDRRGSSGQARVVKARHAGASNAVLGVGPPRGRSAWRSSGRSASRPSRTPPGCRAGSRPGSPPASRPRPRDRRRAASARSPCARSSSAIPGASRSMHVARGLRRHVARAEAGAAGGDDRARRAAASRSARGDRGALVRHHQRVVHLEARLAEQPAGLGPGRSARAPRAAESLTVITRRASAGSTLGCVDGRSGARTPIVDHRRAATLDMTLRRCSSPGAAVSQAPAPASSRDAHDHRHRHRREGPADRRPGARRGRGPGERRGARVAALRAGRPAADAGRDRRHQRADGAPYRLHVVDAVLQLPGRLPEGTRYAVWTTGDRPTQVVDDSATTPPRPRRR